MEARHRVHASRPSATADVVAVAGDPPSSSALFRSSAKPIQALPLARSRPDLGDAEIAIACASHRAGAGADRRRAQPACEGSGDGGRPRVRRAGGPAARRRSTTTAPGKHAGFLAVCQRARLGDGGYRLRRPPAAAARSLEEVAGSRRPRIGGPADGDRRLRRGHVRDDARAHGRGVRPARPRSTAPTRVLAAMRARPELVGGEGSLDTLLMSQTARLGGEGRRRGPALRHRARRDGLCR